MPRGRGGCTGWAEREQGRCPSPKTPPKFGAHLASGQEFSLSCFFHAERNRKGGKSTSDLCSLIACWSWLLSRAGWFTCNSSWKTHLWCFWKRSSLQKRTSTLDLFGTEINKWLTNNESRKKFFKKRACIKINLIETVKGFFLLAVPQCAFIGKQEMENSLKVHL